MQRLALLTALISAGALFGQQTSNPTPQPDTTIGQANESGAIYGQIKEVKGKEKIVIDVENGKNKTYNLADPKVTVDVADGLAVGDRVKILETKNKSARSVQIVRDVRADAERSRQK